MSNIDELSGLPLVKAFAEALGLDPLIDGSTVKVFNGFDYNYWYKLPTDLIIREFNRIKPNVWWSEKRTICNVEESVVSGDEEQNAKGPNLEIALARLVCKLAKEER